MTNKSGQIGTWTETAIVRHLRANGFAGADEMTQAQRLRLAGQLDQGDIGVCPGVMCQSKGGHMAEQASDAQIYLWLRETELERVHRGATYAFLVWKRKGKGAASAGQWWAAMSGETFYWLANDVSGAIVYMSNKGLPLPDVRMTLADVERLLRLAGYGSPLGDTP